LAALDLRQPVQVLELDLAALAPDAAALARKVQLPSRQPSVRRDLAVLVPDAVGYGQLAACISVAAGPLLIGQGLFDQYRGPGVPDGQRSLALSLTWQDPERTLTDTEVADAEQRVIAALAAECGATVRG
jgi:phenylalanyl-tRNA synthetase beta chain